MATTMDGMEEIRRSAAAVQQRINASPNRFTSSEHTRRAATLEIRREMEADLRRQRTQERLRAVTGFITRAQNGVVNWNEERKIRASDARIERDAKIQQAGASLRRKVDSVKEVGSNVVVGFVREGVEFAKACRDEYRNIENSTFQAINASIDASEARREASNLKWIGRREAVVNGAKFLKDSALKLTANALGGGADLLSRGANAVINLTQEAQDRRQDAADIAASRTEVAIQLAMPLES